MFDDDDEELSQPVIKPLHRDDIDLHVIEEMESRLPPGSQMRFLGDLGDNVPPELQEHIDQTMARMDRSLADGLCMHCDAQMEDYRPGDDDWQPPSGWIVMYSPQSENEEEDIPVGWVCEICHMTNKMGTPLPDGSVMMHVDIEMPATEENDYMIQTGEEGEMLAKVGAVLTRNGLADTNRNRKQFIWLLKNKAIMPNMFPDVTVEEMKELRAGFVRIYGEPDDLQEEPDGKSDATGAAEPG